MGTGRKRRTKQSKGKGKKWKKTKEPEFGEKKHHHHRRHKKNYGKTESQVAPDKKVEVAPMPYAQGMSDRFRNASGTLFVPNSQTRKGNANKLFIESARYLTPDQEKQVKDLDVKRKNYVDHMAKEQEALGKGEYGTWLATRDFQRKTFMDAIDQLGMEESMAYMDGYKRITDARRHQVEKHAAMREQYGEATTAMIESENHLMESLRPLTMKHVTDHLASHGNMRGFEPLRLEITPHGVYDITTRHELDEIASNFESMKKFMEVDLAKEQKPIPRFDEDKKLSYGFWMGGNYNGWNKQYKERLEENENDSHKSLKQLRHDMY
jgi:hypothetical protein